MPVIRECYAALPETPVYPTEQGGRTHNKILMGTWAGVVEDNGGERVKVSTAGRDGWVYRDALKDQMDLKVFFVDVGQGDGLLLESPGLRMLVDGGPNQQLLRYLKGYQYRYLLGNPGFIQFDLMVVSHFDADHYKGLTAVLNDPLCRVDSLIHNGIARFSTRRASRPAGHDTDLGQRRDDHLVTSFSDIDDARALLAGGGLQRTFEQFLRAAVNAHSEGRLGAMRRVDHRTGRLLQQQGLSVDILGPVTEDIAGSTGFRWLGGSSHTRNGHSVVLRVDYKRPATQGHTLLLGGDLNHEAQTLLMAHYHPDNPFRVDVCKACHHGSADFSVGFLQQVLPYATVISSGDNESYAHPRAEALGCAGRYSRGEQPLVFSTELARSVSSGGDVLYGMINCRSDGRTLMFSQMKERNSGADIWDSYVVQRQD
ncbi:hypothetical protein LJ739_15795 [Aestuariibacter halophilus]|uniref:Metallo-beta-lactamase domain-containing protein n=1 Tax=Fluctibacter halophilus TaxID=226011 RepID=A0ABS8GCY4_9ALTE|nr:hypothetical protein [Aestuariibacter halophilus]MCC2617715.1 hypothetical protein [Aestuariibacter halophilus]